MLPPPALDATAPSITNQPSLPSTRPKLLVIELWGLGDLTFSTPLLRAAQASYDITLLGKAHAKPLLAASFPSIQFVAYDAPWTAYRDKYRLWEWDWRELRHLIADLRWKRFDAAVSVRNDPRDHLLMCLIGAERRYGFPLKGSAAFLTHPLERTREKQHKVEDWRDIGRALQLPGMNTAEPQLDHPAYRTPRVDSLLSGITNPLVVLHPGARIPVRRWPEPHFARIIEKMRAHYDFHLALIPDPDGYGEGLASLSDQCLPQLAVDELIDILGRVELLLCNDSGPAHLAASCGRPALPMFGPTEPAWFRPWGAMQEIFLRDICPWRPCFDYCLFDEPYCMTKLLPDMVWPDIHAHIERLIAAGIVSSGMRKQDPVLA